MKYPVYVISKGRSSKCLTARFLERDGTPFRLVVEPQEVDAYADIHGNKVIEVLPFSNLGQGSIPARNWVWENAKSLGHERHWILDDNMWMIYRRYRAIKIRCNSRIALSIYEEFIDRYENIGIGGLAYEMFVPNRQRMPPYYLNVHVYSCLLIRNDLPYRWRGRYNEDTDLCLQVLSGGLCTVLINAFMVDKIVTGAMEGGNTTELYQDDGRCRMARSLQRAWPYIVETKRRFGRPQHVIRDTWKKFDTPLKRRTDIDFDALEADGPNEFGMKLQQVKVVKSPFIQQLLRERGTPDD